MAFTESGRKPSQTITIVRGREPWLSANISGDELSITKLNFFMHIHITLLPIISLIAGIIILVKPRLLSFIVAFYLIAVGLIGIFGLGHFRLH